MAGATTPEISPGESGDRITAPSPLSLSGYASSMPATDASGREAVNLAPLPSNNLLHNTAMHDVAHTRR